MVSETASTWLNLRPQLHMEDPLSFPHVHADLFGPEHGPPVLLLHGWGSSAQLMLPLASALSDTFRVLNVDLPGHGHSADPPEAWGVPEHAALVANLVQRHLRGRIAVVGHSNGGRIALFMASDERYCGLIERLVLVSPSGVRPPRGLKYHLKRSVASALKAPFSVMPAPVRDLGMDWLRHSLLWRLLGSSDYRNLEGVMRETFVRTVNFHLDDRLHQIQVPTLVFWGDRDTAVTRHQIDVLKERIPDVGVVVLAGAGHYGYLDDPDTVVAATRHFLSVTEDQPSAPVEEDRA